MELYISNSGQEPIYAQITRQIKAKFERRIAAGRCTAQHPPVGEGAAHQRDHHQRAYEDLEADGFITTMPGRGSFVAPQNPALHRRKA